MTLNFFNYRKGFKIYTSAVGFGLLLLSASCSEEGNHREGEKLAKVHCASCHMHTDPSILPRRVWGDKILPNMGLKMGMSHGPIYAYGTNETTEDLLPTLSQEDWDKIVHYYLNESDNSIPVPQHKRLAYSDLFDPQMYLLDSLPLISMTSFDKTSQKLTLGTGSNSNRLTLNIDGEIIASKKLESPLVKLAYRDSIEYALTIGNLNPSDKAEGVLNIGNSSIANLMRPVDFLVNDINSDGYNDVFVCNYGNNVGDFSLYENLKDGTYKKRRIHPLSGAIKVILANIDSDQENEVIVLFAQEHETLMIWDYENDEFIGKKAIQFQPAFGSVDFQIVDMNDDGLKDIIIGNGDNSDLSTVLKKFHGVRIFLNQGHKEFKEAFFYPMHGVSKISVHDFNLDGAFDIMAISNFGNFTDPNYRSVQYISNDGAMNFTANAIRGLENFRWQTIDVVDYDSDGDLDIFLGSFDLAAGPEESNIENKNNITWTKMENTRISQ